MIDETAHASDWLSIPEVAEALGVRLRDVRTMLAERRLLAVRRGDNEAWAIPAGLLTRVDDGGAQPLASLRGTLVQLGDAGMSDEECMTWLYSPNDELGEPPIEALRAGRIHAVRRAAQPLAF
ncbi:DNA-binding protein [Ruania suaedae]|uniref:Rv2175c family DNA-binding protein n=1 Tax=Ruania suaedae TaxID=2897774 RepID=UPI001E3122A6|nr:Rv2175c family DNA-binding protein [Ruania suaedae]UFU01629.1 DNA-binding protein [Ruania suaedae]